MKISLSYGDKFDWELYLEYNPDLKDKGIITENQARNHYIKYGKAENRIMHSGELSPQRKDEWKTRTINKLLEHVPDDFNARNYLLMNKDIYQNGIKTEQAAKLHYVKYGQAEGRKYSKEQKPEPEPTISSSIKLRSTGEKINILIRNTYRPTYFQKCIQSILNQTYQDYRLIMCYDDDNCMDYLNEYIGHEKMEIFKAREVDKSCSHFYNLYCNELLEYVKSDDGWIMFLDDDDMFENPNSLSIIAENIHKNNSSTNNIFLWNFLCGIKQIIPQIQNNIILPNTIANCSYCFHSTYKSMSKWELLQQGDYKFINNLLKISNTTLNIIHLNIILAKTIDDNIINGHFGKKEPIIETANTNTNTIIENANTKISIIMPYHNRRNQTILTLNGFERLYVNKYNFEVVIVDDNSNKNEKLTDIINNFSFEIKYIELTEKSWINPVIPFNMAITNVSPDADIIIIQSPEIFHCENILEHTLQNLSNENYLVYPVYSSPSYEENANLENVFKTQTQTQTQVSNYYTDFIQKIDYNKYRGEYDDRVIDIWKGWLQHKTFNDRQLHFLSAITKVNMDKIGGFCTEMKDGLWYDDDDFLHRLSKIVKPISVESNKYIGIHQKHENGSTNQRFIDNFDELSQKNKTIYLNNQTNNVIYCDPTDNTCSSLDNYSNNIRNKNTKISIVMAYFNRKPQTLETFKGFEKMYAGKYNFEVVIVDDNSNDENRLEEDIKQFSFPINLIVISKEEKGDRINPCIAYNRGFAEATGEIIIIQNPECFHVGDIINHTLSVLSEQDYFSYSCFTANSPEITKKMIEYENVFELIKSQEFLDKNVTDASTQMNWYNHPTDTAHGGRNTAYHFCNAIYKSKLDLIGGFDKRFADGYCFDDDELLLAVKYNLKLDIKIIEPEKCFVIHQYHTKNPSFNIDKQDDNNEIKQKWLKNKKLFQCKKLNYILENEDVELNKITEILIDNKILKKVYLIENNFNNIINKLNNYSIQNTNYNNYKPQNGIYNPLNIDFINNIPKILFTYWDMSNLTFMHFLTLYTIRKHHPDYDIILYYPKKRFTAKTWKSFENKIQTTCKSYINYLKLLNIKIIEIDFEENIPDIPFYLSEVIKSDFFRLYISKEVGGIWFDMDTFWINSIENTFSTNETNYYEDLIKLNEWYNKENIVLNNNYNNLKKFNDSYFVMAKNNQDKLDDNYAHFCQYILFHNKNSQIIKLLYDSCINNLNCDSYESIGTPMFSKILSNYMLKDTEFNYNKSILNINIFAPFKWFQMDELFEKTINIKLDKSACLHWFNGSTTTKKFIEKITHHNFENIHECSFKNIFNNYLNNNDKLFLKNLDNDINLKKVSIVMAYYNRKIQLIETLESIKLSSYKNIEIIIVDDNSIPEQRVDSFINEIKGTLDIKVITITEDIKTWVNPCIPYNIGFKKATGDIIIIQNPEVIHVGDCILNVVNNLKPHDWLSFNCYGSPNFEFNNSLKNKTSNECFKLILNSSNTIGGNSVVRNDVGGWVNHYEKHFVAYHYLAAIHRNDLFEIMNGGFDEIFKDGIGADDDEYIKRLIYNKFNFKINIFKENNPFAIHLYHDKPESLRKHNHLNNKKYFIENCKQMNFVPENNIHLAPKSEIPMSRRIIID